jgi:hypothetical protein
MQVVHDSFYCGLIDGAASLTLRSSRRASHPWPAGVVAASFEGPIAAGVLCARQLFADGATKPSCRTAPRVRRPMLTTVVGALIVIAA